MRELPALSEAIDDSFEISHEVKVWRFKKGEPGYIKFPADESNKLASGLYMKKGPFFEKWKYEVKKISASIINHVQQENVDWNKPDDILIVSPKWMPAVQTVKF